MATSHHLVTTRNKGGPRPRSSPSLPLLFQDGILAPEGTHENGTPFIP